MKYLLLFVWAVASLYLGLVRAEQFLDVVSGSSVTLKCRFDPQLNQKRSTLYWIRSNRINHDNVAIGETAFHQDYRVDHKPREGRYDLHLSHANYDRDNGRFECRIKEDGTGVELYTVTVGVTVLLPPGPASITKSSVEAVEGQPYVLSCSSKGGSPPPDITWTRGLSDIPLVSNLTRAADKDAETVSVLEIIPRKEDDGVEYKCDVSNRAITTSHSLGSSINISVNYFPDVSVGPDNPYRVELDQTAEVVCRVDSKPPTETVRWEFSGRFIDTNFRHVIPQVSLGDAGSYYCSGDNGLGHVDKEELILDVQYGPQAVVSGANDVDVGDTVSINCQVSANPRPLGIQWFRRGDPAFVQQGQTLHISKVSAKDSGEYICNSYNFIHPSGGERERKEKNVTVTVNVRHKPGKASILPEEAIAVAGRAVTLVCHADPPGYPEPTYKWWRDGRDSTILSVSSHYTIETVEASSAGKYLCQPHNSLGQVAPASVHLQVYQTPRITSKPKPRMVKKTGDANLQISCSSVAKPKPKVRWFKDGVEIVSGVSTSHRVSTNEQGQSVLSTLSFVGPARSNTNRLSAADKGHYSCQFENQVGRSESTMLLVIEHAPIPAHKYNKVAFDLGDKGQIGCRMRAYPEPSFDWTFDDDVLELDRVNYFSNVTQLDQDLFESVLTVTRVRGTSYGEYTCRALNTVGAERTKIVMQRKGPPEQPSGLAASEVGADFAMLEWSPGFDGGHGDTYFVVEYTRASDGAVDTGVCQAGAGCNVTGLVQHSGYSVRVRAKNSAGESEWSDSVTVTTLVDLTNIPRAESLIFEKSTNTAHVQAPATELLLVAELEAMSEDGAWRRVGDTRMETGSYSAMSVDLVRLTGPVTSTYNQLPITDQGLTRTSEERQEEVAAPVPELRVRLCLEENMGACGPYLEAKMVEELALGQSWLVALIVIVTLLGLVALLIAIKCVCQTRKKSQKNAAVLAGHRHANNIDSYKAQMFAIAADNQHPGPGPGYDLQTGLEPGGQSGAASHTDSANSQEPLWAYQKSPSDYYPSAALEGYDNTGHPGGHMGSYPYIDETPTDAGHGHYFPPGGQEARSRAGSRISRPISGQYNCATGMGESQYSYGGLPDPASYFTSQGNIFICDNSGGGGAGGHHHHGPGPDNGGGGGQGDGVGLATPNTRARRVVHEVIV